MWWLRCNEVYVKSFRIATIIKTSMWLSKIDFFPIKKILVCAYFGKRGEALKPNKEIFSDPWIFFFFLFFFWVSENFVSVSKRAYFFNVRPSLVIYVEPELYPCIFEAFLLSLEGKIEPAENFFIKTGLLKISICWTWSYVCFWLVLFNLQWARFRLRPSSPNLSPKWIINVQLKYFDCVGYQSKLIKCNISCRWDSFKVTKKTSCSRFFNLSFLFLFSQCAKSNINHFAKV